jgi:thioredoxin reductase
LENAGVKILPNEMKTPVYNSETMETNRENIYLAGVICGGLETHKWFIENSRLHASLIIQDLKNKNKLHK